MAKTARVHSVFCWEEITSLRQMYFSENLKILALGRNNIKSLVGIEAAGDTLEQLWISYNSIDKLKGVQALKKLKIFYIAYNMVKDWAEYARFNEMPALEEICFFGMPTIIFMTHVTIPFHGPHNNAFSWPT